MSRDPDGYYEYSWGRVAAPCMFVYAAFAVELLPVESPVFPYACLSKGMHE